MNIYKNSTNIALPVAVWLVQNEYDYSNNPNVISATTLLDPIRKIVLGRQNNTLDKVVDIESLIASKMGTAIHNGIEAAWLKDRATIDIALKNLGYPQKVIDKIKINPKIEDLTPDDIPIFMEIRKEKQVGDYIISGKFDFIENYQINDFKSTSVMSWINKSNDLKYIQQASIYRWLNPELVKEDTMKIQFFFTDWSGKDAKKDPKYPRKRQMEKLFQLMSIEETDQYINSKLSKIKVLEDKPQSMLPRCTREELWQREDLWKYYKNPTSTRATKNFTNEAEASLRFVQDGSVGVVKHIPGEVIRCRYCNVANICEQSQEYVRGGNLIL